MRRLNTGLFVLALSIAVSAQMIPLAEAQVQLRGQVTHVEREANRLFQVGQWEKAEKLYTDAVRRNPKNASYQANLSLVQAKLFKLDAAEQSAKKSLSLNSKNPYAHLALGDVYKNRTASSDMTYRNQRDQLLQRARAEYQAALQLDPNNPDAYNHLGELHRLMGSWSEAKTAFERAVSLDRRFSEATANLGTVYQQEGQHDKAIEQYRKAIQLNSKNDRAHYYLGEALFSKGNYHEALKSLNTALSLNRNNVQVVTKMGEAYEAQGNHAAAIAKYRDAIQLKPEHVEAYRHLANIFNARGDAEFAIVELKSALNSNPKYTPFKLEIGRLSLLAEKPQQAVNYYSEVLKEQPQNPEALQGLAQAYSMLAYQTAASGEASGADRYVEAEQAIDAALMANPNNLQLHLAKLRISKLSGQPPMTEMELRQLAEIPVRTQDDDLIRAEVQFELGQFQASDAAYRQWIQHYGNNISELSALADSLTVTGNLDMAEEAYHEIQRKDVDNLKAMRGIQRIQNRRNEADKSYRLASALDSRFSRKKQRSAKDFFMESAALYPRQAMVRKELADSYAKEDQYAKAALEYEAYVNLATDLTDGQRQHYQKKINDLRLKAANKPQTQP